MNIGLYKEPTNLAQIKYRGIYRQNGIIDLFLEESNDSRFIKAMEWYFSKSREGFYLKYTERNETQLISLYGMLRNKNWDGELLLFTDKTKAIIPYGYEFIGYDVCADSMYYSPIGDGFLEDYHIEGKFFSDMNYDEYEDYKNNLNNKGLFQSYDLAIKFSKYCTNINEKHKYVIETENHWRPFVVYALNIG